MHSKNDQLDLNSFKKGFSMRVLWTISDYKIINEAIKEEEARKMLFKPLDLGETYITFNGRTCSNVFFKRDIVKTQEYIKSTYNIMPQALNIYDEIIEVIKTNCELPGFAEYIRLKDRRLIIHIEGVFFFFEPVVNY
ncbi:MAG: hypothetical protein N2511_06390 [Thermodesulfovibrionales bacterium]|nr:hypothetical protein [Thermodesulfovibrionales bacterium]